LYLNDLKWEKDPMLRCIPYGEQRILAKVEENKLLLTQLASEIAEIKNFFKMN
jgi:hypothetical protein